MASRSIARLRAVVFAIGALSSAPASADIVVYNAQHESLTKAWIEAFTKETGIRVTYRQGSDLELGNVLVQEGRNSPADVFLTENSPAMALVESAGQFAPIDPATLAMVPINFRPSSGNWVGIAARTTVLVYNKAKVSAAELPKSLVELGSEKWRKRWAASPSGADFQAIVGALLELNGEPATSAWLRAMKTNSTAYRGNEAVMRAVNAGQVDAGVIFHYYYFQDQVRTGESSKNVELHYFRNRDPGAFVSISGGGVLASSKNKAEAQRFLKWIVGTSGQELLRMAMEYAVATGAASHPKLPPIDGLDAPKLDPTRLDSRKVTELMTRAGLL